MPLMTERTAQVLGAVLAEYVKTGAPVSSQQLQEVFDVSSATLRNELALLTEHGLLEQPHVSSGRVPTDRGYRLIVSRLLESRERDAQRAAYVRHLAALQNAFQQRAFEDFIFTIAEELHTFGVGYGVQHGSLYRGRLDELLTLLVQREHELEVSDVAEIVHDIERLDESVEKLVAVLPNQGAPVVFIGRSPVTRSPHLSVIVDKFTDGQDELVVASIGPKAMDYGRALGFFMGLREALEAGDK